MNQQMEKHFSMEMELLITTQEQRFLYIRESSQTLTGYSLLVTGCQIQD